MPVMRRLLSVLLLPAALASTSVPAAVVESFYRVEIPQTEEQSRDEIIREGAEVMLRRLAGDQLDPNAAPFARALSDPRSLMRRIANTDRGTVAMEFEPALLRDVLANAGSAMLGRNRPGVLVWAVDAQSLGDELVSQGSRWADILRRAAEHRAVPVSFPLGDIEDRGRVSEADIRQADDDVLAAASERYGPEGVLAIGARSTEDEAQLNWTLWLNQQEYSGEVKAADPETAADELMKAVAGQIFEQYAVPAASDSELTRWTVVVNEVDTLAEFAAIQRMIQQLGARSAPQLLAVDGDQVTFQLAFPQDEAQLERMLALEHRMRRTEPPEPEPVIQPLTTAAPAGPIADEPATAGETDAPDSQAAPADAGSPVQETADTDPVPSAEPSEPQAAVPEPDPNTLYYRWR
ncbi:hypothetical protein SAMN05216421_2079 [Halopseudomonas xinjiangensis]|uniref:DUF2066 domain-containing protein n=1 Tax=Halopseudomonas xinjiangensis TaxID=487184 RepID=A0A1H1UKW6_9GAMM|nr:DUF2066 domain-containing protein [Halopseudomonas xinjiangensis]SDS73115.1 hypothetical protein SAMN05216421_2079 [Halopseudomonas xinjiangensis]